MGSGCSRPRNDMGTPADTTSAPAPLVQEPTPKPRSIIDPGANGDTGSDGGAFPDRHDPSIVVSDSSDEEHDGTIAPYYPNMNFGPPPALPPGFHGQVFFRSQSDVASLFPPRRRVLWRC